MEWSAAHSDSVSASTEAMTLRRTNPPYSQALDFGLSLHGSNDLEADLQLVANRRVLAVSASTEAMTLRRRLTGPVIFEYSSQPPRKQ